MGFVGAARDERTHRPVPYMASLPSPWTGTRCSCWTRCWPRRHAGARVELVMARGATAITAICVLAAPEGLATVEASGLPVRVLTAQVDERLKRRQVPSCPASVTPGPPVRSLLSGLLSRTTDRACRRRTVGRRTWRASRRPMPGRRSGNLGRVAGTLRQQRAQLQGDQPVHRRPTSRWPMVTGSSSRSRPRSIARRTASSSGLKVPGRAPRTPAPGSSRHRADRTSPGRSAARPSALAR